MMFTQWTFNGIYCFTACPYAAAIGQMYGVHRVTVRRWIFESQQAVHAITRRVLSDSIGDLEPEEAAVLAFLRERLARETNGSK